MAEFHAAAGRRSSVVPSCMVSVAVSRSQWSGKGGRRGALTPPRYREAKGSVSWSPSCWVCLGVSGTSGTLERQATPNRPGWDGMMMMDDACFCRPAAARVLHFAAGPAILTRLSPVSPCPKETGTGSGQVRAGRRKEPEARYPEALLSVEPSTPQTVKLQLGRARRARGAGSSITPWLDHQPAKGIGDGAGEVLLSLGPQTLVLWPATGTRNREH